MIHPVQEEIPCDVLSSARYRKGPEKCFDYNAMVKCWSWWFSPFCFSSVLSVSFLHLSSLFFFALSLNPADYTKSCMAFNRLLLRFNTNFSLRLLCDYHKLFILVISFGNLSWLHIFPGPEHLIDHANLVKFFGLNSKGFAFVFHQVIKALPALCKNRTWSRYKSLYLKWHGMCFNWSPFQMVLKIFASKFFFQLKNLMPM